MREYDEIVRNVVWSISGAIDEGHGNKEECLRLINWAKTFDIDEFMKNVQGHWSKDSIRWDVIRIIKTRMGFVKECPTCLEDDSDYIDYVERVTMPNVNVVKCKNCGTQYGYW